MSVYSNVQNVVTDTSTDTSIVGGIFYALASQIEDLYAKIEDVSTQSYIATAEGIYLDRLVEGTFGKARRGATRAQDYATIFAKAPLLDPSDLDIRYAEINELGEIDNLSQATKFVSGGGENTSNRVFVVTRPKNDAYVDTQNRKIIIPTDSAYQFFVLPVLSVSKGSSQNVSEGAISIYTDANTNVVGGVINTYNLPATFFNFYNESEIPFSVRFTKVLGFTASGSKFSVVNSYTFSSTGVVSLETSSGYKFRGKFYNQEEGDLTKVVERDIILPYKSNDNLSIVLAQDFTVTSIDNIPFVYIQQNNGRVKYLLHSVFDGTTWVSAIPTNPANPTNTDIRNILNLMYHASLSTGLIQTKLSDLYLRQVKEEFDLSLVFDPDDVVNADGIISANARLLATDAEDDVSYRISLQKYLASLARATPTALEAGALSIPGVAYAKVIDSRYSPKGSTTMLVSGYGGGLPSNILIDMKSTLEKEWKAAGISLILKTPKIINMSVLMSVTISKNTSKDLIRSQIESTILSYLSDKNPGDSISYSEVLSGIQGIDGVINVWDMFLGKYVVFKDISDRLFVSSVITQDLYTPATLTGYLGVLAAEKFTTLSFKDRYYLNVSNKSDLRLYIKSGSGIALATTNPDHQEDSDTWDAFIQKLRNITTTQDYVKFVLNEAYFSGSADEVKYKIIKQLTQSLDSTVSVKFEPSTNISNLKIIDFRRIAFKYNELVLLGYEVYKKESLPLIGINFITEQ